MSEFIWHLWGNTNPFVVPQCHIVFGHLLAANNSQQKHDTKTQDSHRRISHSKGCVVWTRLPGSGESIEAEHRHKAAHSDQRPPVVEIHNSTFRLIWPDHEKRLRNVGRQPACVGTSVARWGGHTAGTTSVVKSPRRSGTASKANKRRCSSCRTGCRLDKHPEYRLPQSPAPSPATEPPWRCGTLDADARARKLAAGHRSPAENQRLWPSDPKSTIPLPDPCDELSL